MENITNKPFKSRKKISLDLNEESLQIIDELAELSKNSRGVIMEALINKGMPPFFTFLEKTWKDYLTDKKYEKAHKELKNLLKGLKDIKAKHLWLDPSYNWEKVLSKKDLDEKTKKELIMVLQNMGWIPKDK